MASLRRDLEIAQDKKDSLKRRLQNADEQIKRLVGDVLERVGDEKGPDMEAQQLKFEDVMEAIEKDVELTKISTWRLMSFSGEQLADLGAALLAK